MNEIFSNQWLLVLAIIWMFPWKGVALWKAARNGHTLAILEILYIFVFSKKQNVVQNKNRDN